MDYSIGYCWFLIQLFDHQELELEISNWSNIYLIAINGSNKINYCFPEWNFLGATGWPKCTVPTLDSCRFVFNLWFVRWSVDLELVCWGADLSLLSNRATMDATPFSLPEKIISLACCHAPDWTPWFPSSMWRASTPVFAGFIWYSSTPLLLTRV